MARSNLQAALFQTARGSPAPERMGGSEAASERPSQQSRIGKVNVTGYFPPDVKASLRLVQAKRGGTIQDILAEALNDVFAKHNVPQTAPRDEDAA